MEKRYIFYGFIIFTCIISLIIGIYSQFFSENTSNSTLNISGKEQELKDNFPNIFNNTLVYINNTISSNSIRKDKSKDIIYTASQYAKTENGKYDMNINIPDLNIDSPMADEINNEIENQFISIARNLLLPTNNKPYTTYYIDYAAYVNSNIVSLILRAKLKEGDNPQRLMIMTYNYNLETNQFVELDELLQIKKISSTNLQTKINKEIKAYIEQTENLASMVSQKLYSRNINNRIYKVENTALYFLGYEGYLYIVYAYGNNDNTSEVDVIVV